MDLFEEIHSSCEAEAFQPLICFLKAKQKKKALPPYIPQCNLLPLAGLCKLALLWREAGFVQEAAALAQWLLKIEPFSTLWCLEKEYNEKQLQRLYAEVRQMQAQFGQTPFFPFRNKADRAILENLDCPRAAIHLEELESSWLKAAFTLDGRGTSLGFIQANGVEIRAFGPQSSSLVFGIQGKGANGWSSLAALPEAWLEMKHSLTEEGLKLDFRFVGLKLEMPVSLAFYVKAKSCEIGGEVWKPKSLRRYLGEAKGASFENRLKIESSELRRIQLIPLAGEGCFWDAEFLLSFELPPFLAQSSFICAPINK